MTCLNGQLSLAVGAFKIHEDSKGSIGMLIVWLTPGALKQPVHARGSLRPFDIAVQIADNRS
jgi:hypothetical protein